MADADKKNLSDAHTEMPALKGRKAVITGGTTGIGRAIAVLLASEGVEIFTCGRNEQHLEDGLKRINEVGKGSGIACDLSKPDDLTRFFDEAEQTLGEYDIAVINAAIPADGLAQMEEDDLRYAIATDFTAYIVSAHRAARHMEDKGDIVLIGSMSAHSLGPSSTVYAGMKAGVAGFAEAMRKELGNKGIKVGFVEPAKTGADFHYPDIPADEQRELINAEEMLRAEDIAVGVHYMLTQPRRAVVQQLVITQRVSDEK
ncbi:SDR family NAD(P)-dependent oxidoreductase [Altererythrobacter aerius]|uniref:SDR family NAD(P)-dependent oxidoreductase n=1 Tax=Tsuneonella aeria TaxID=1837929 RepID=A0A6I4TBT4_9SPHN|nr:SDR family oxidoreductase [Tsuneonella aeria]MXO74712.1 SDR family NAD(P)-dependent oxidoreductase [Tsuneonella aeria]